MNNDNKYKSTLRTQASNEAPINTGIQLKKPNKNKVLTNSITCRLPKNVHDALVKKCNKEGLSISNAIHQLVCLYTEVDYIE